MKHVPLDRIIAVSRSVGVDRRPWDGTDTHTELSACRQFVKRITIDLGTRQEFRVGDSLGKWSTGPLAFLDGLLQCRTEIEFKRENLDQFFAMSSLWNDA